MANQKKPWTRNQKLILWGIILGAIVGVFAHIEISIHFIQKDIKDINILKAKIERLIAKSGEFETLVASKTIAVTGIGQNDFGQGLVINTGGGQDTESDFQVMGGHDENMIFGKAGTDFVGIGTATPRAKLDVVGHLRIGRMSTGKAPGLELCVDKNNILCVCGQCDQ